MWTATAAPQMARSGVLTASWPRREEPLVPPLLVAQAQLERLLAMLPLEAAVLSPLPPTLVAMRAAMLAEVMSQMTARARG